jgi:hypothetical protein
VAPSAVGPGSRYGRRRRRPGRRRRRRGRLGTSRKRIISERPGGVPICIHHFRDSTLSLSAAAPSLSGLEGVAGGRRTPLSLPSSLTDRSLLTALIFWKDRFLPSWAASGAWERFGVGSSRGLGRREEERGFALSPVPTLRLIPPTEFRGSSSIRKVLTLDEEVRSFPKCFFSSWFMLLTCTVLLLDCCLSRINNLSY